MTVDQVTDNSSGGSADDCGFVTRVRGSVIDVEFASGRLPPLNNALAIELSHDLRLIAEVLLDSSIVLSRDMDWPRTCGSSMRNFSNWKFSRGSGA
jgi:hypothetical protein